MSPKRSITPQVSRHCSGDLFTSLSAASLMMFALLAGPIFAPTTTTTTVTYPTVAGSQNEVYNSATSDDIEIIQGAGAYALEVKAAFHRIVVQPQFDAASGALTITMSNCTAQNYPAITLDSANNIQLSSITIVLRCPWTNQRTLMKIGSGTPLTVTVDIYSNVSLWGSGDDLIRISDNSWSTRPSLFAVNIYSGSTKISKSAGSDWGPFVFTDAPSSGNRWSSSNMSLSLSSGASVTLSSSSAYPAAIFGFSNSVNSLPAMSIGIAGSTVTAISSSALVALGATMPIPSFAMSVTSSTIVLKQSSSVVTVDKQSSGGSDAPYSFTRAVSLSFTSSILSLSGASSIFDIVSNISSSGAFYFTSTTVALASSSSLVSRYGTSSGTFNGLSFVMDNATLTVSSSSGLVLGSAVTVNGATFTMMNRSVADINSAVLMSVSAVLTSTCIFTLNSSAMLGLLGNSVALKVVNSVAGISLSMTSGAAMTVSSGSSFFTGSRLYSWSSTLSNYASISVVSCTFLATKYVTYVADRLTNTANISLRSSTWLSAMYTSMSFVSTIATSSHVELLSQSQWVKSSLIGSNAPRLEVSGSGSLLVSDSSTWWSGTTVSTWSVSVLSASQMTLQLRSQLLQFISGGGGGCAVTVDGVSTSVSVVDQSSLWSTAAALNFSIGSLGGTGRVSVLYSSTLLSVTSAPLSNVRVSIVNTAVEFTPSSSVGWLLQGPSQSTTSSVAVSLIGASFVCRESPHWDVCRQRWMSGVSTLSPAVNVTSSTLRWGTRQRAIPTQMPFAIAGTTNNRVDLSDGNLGGSESKSQTQTSSSSESVDFTSSQSASQSLSSSPSATSVTPRAVATLTSSEQTTVSVSPVASPSAAFTASAQVTWPLRSIRSNAVISRRVRSTTVVSASTSSNLSWRITKSPFLLTTPAFGTSNAKSGYRSPFLSSTHSLHQQCLLLQFHAVDYQASNLLCQTHLCPVTATSEGATLHVGYDELNAAPSLLLLLNSPRGSGLSAWVRMPSLVTLEGTTIAFIAVNDSFIDASVTVAVLLQRSLSGWPGVADRPYATQRLSLIVSMSCVFNESLVYRNEVLLVVDPRSPPVAAAVGVAMQSSQAVAGVGGAGAVALTVGRLMVSLAVLSCENVLQGRGPGAGVLSVSGGLLAVVDTIMGNALFLVLVGAATVGSGLAVFRWHCAALPGCSFVAFMRIVLRLPHSLFPACAAMLPSTVTAIVALLRDSPVEGGVAAGAYLSTAAAVIGLSGFIWLVAVATRQMVSGATLHRRAPSGGLPFVVQGAFVSQTEWLPSSSDASLFEGTTRLWFVPLDLCVAIAMAVASSLPIAHSASVCLGANIVNATGCLVMLVVVTVWRPFSTTFGKVHAIVTSLLLLSSVVCGLAFVAVTQHADNGAQLPASASRLLAAIGYVSGGVVALSFLKALVDIVSIVTGARERMAMFRSSFVSTGLLLEELPSLPSADVSCQSPQMGDDDFMVPGESTPDIDMFIAGWFVADGVELQPCGESSLLPRLDRKEAATVALHDLLSAYTHAEGDVERGII